MKKLGLSLVDILFIGRNFDWNLCIESIDTLSCLNEWILTDFYCEMEFEINQCKPKTTLTSNRINGLLIKIWLSKNLIVTSSSIFNNVASDNLKPQHLPRVNPQPPCHPNKFLEISIRNQTNVTTDKKKYSCSGFFFF